MATHCVTPIAAFLRRRVRSRLDVRYVLIVTIDIEGVRNMNVLYLEDDPAYVELITSILETSGYRVHAVSNGNQAIRHLESSVVDLLILDWRVPDMSGFEVLQWTRERIGGRLPILFLTQPARR
ncbi:response regulator [Burkholderia sp. IMCC1007]|uniref:response regulator n=1 Tax=Burkholderia sp. IMCC1007 TaxID=3004104 RepID=UPI0022B4167B|nr:response regulator [Burkholderia sp. IMCC1007]